jgi:PAS domain S-box-containing protein
MDIKNMGKKISLVVIFVTVTVALCWLTQKNFRDFEETIVTQTRQPLNIIQPENSSTETFVENIQKKNNFFAQAPEIQKAVIYNSFITLLAAFALGYVFYKIGSINVAKPKDTLDQTPRTYSHVKELNKQLQEKVKQLTAELKLANEALEGEIAQRPLIHTGLQQRIKHLNCFYGLSRLIEQPKVTLEQILQETVNLIRDACQYPEATCVRITFDGIHYKTDNFDKSELSQYAHIMVRSEKAGVIEAYYLGGKVNSGEAPFLKEERDLLDVVAERLGRIIELKQAGEELLLFRNLIDRSNDCIFVIEPRWGRLLDVNNRACDSLGYTREELLNMTVKDIELVIPDDSSWQACVEELKLKGDITIEGQHRCKDATTFFVETSLKIVSHGKEDYIIAVTRDITERKKAEEKQAKLIQELKSINQRVKGINQELEDFAHIVSHDLKAPLRGIKTLADWISTGYGDKFDERGKEQMNLLLAQVERMHSLIEGVLQYSRVGRVKEKQIQVNLNELVPEIIEMVAPPENIVITIENQLPVIECEQTRIIQLFENLLSNAVKYMDKPQGQVRVGCVEEDGFWKFSVADNGPGIEEKHFERIFRIFQTLSAQNGFQSTGIGLTLIKKIVELYGGKIWVESKLGQGSTFFFTLPKLKKEATHAKLEANITC